MFYATTTEKCLPKKNVRHITFLSGYVCSDALRMFWQVVTDINHVLTPRHVTEINYVDRGVAARTPLQCRGVLGSREREYHMILWVFSCQFWKSSLKLLSNQRYAFLCLQRNQRNLWSPRTPLSLGVSEIQLPMAYGIAIQEDGSLRHKRMCGIAEDDYGLYRLYAQRTTTTGKLKNWVKFRRDVTFLGSIAYYW